GAGAWPILALREGERQRTGIVLATPGAAVARVAAAGDRAAPALSLGFEASLEAAEPLPGRPVDLTLPVILKGSMEGYTWSQEMPSTSVRQGTRVALEFRNMSPMAHPMHLHGHHFQVVAIDGRRVAGAVRDTVLVTPMSTLTVVFDADNPGRWPLHCHNLLHMAAGMTTDLVYDGTS
ncbi:MAG TPA: multicopper oxidase domain-containing protein, partial [Arenibaculum sp.]|nr:multicopper oxidase domain-containing protein [Arenibaculum sp.]